MSLRALVGIATFAISALAAGCAGHDEGGGNSSSGSATGGSTNTGGSHAGGAGTGGESCEVYCPFGPVCGQSCTPGKVYDCPLWPEAPTLTCVHVPPGCPGTGKWQGDCTTPLVLVFDRAPVDFRSAVASFDFDLNGTGTSVATDWPSARTPWLALDRDGDGRIGGGGELFGSATRLADGSRAANGFVALRELDDDGDGRITPSDKAWSRLLLWSDRDGDHASTAGELASLASRRLLSIELGYRSEPRCDDRGNCEVERASFRYLDEAGVERTGDVVDVHLARR